jgi:CBS domain-containing protein
MRISDVLRGKGRDVATIGPTATVGDLVAALGEHNIGAAVVVEGGGTEDRAVVGIVSERDVVRRLLDRGGELLSATVGEIMTRDVLTCSPDDTVDHLAEVMTERRIRHMPVLADGRLVGIVSIGDVVKTRMEELETSQEQLQAYIAHG